MIEVVRLDATATRKRPGPVRRTHRQAGDHLHLRRTRQHPKSAAGAVTVPNGGGGGLSFGGGGGGGTQGHHMIPEYMCGAAKQFELVDLPLPQHSLLHKQLERFVDTVTVYDVVFRKRKVSEKKSPIVKTARTSQGRVCGSDV